METKKLADELRETIYLFGKNDALKPKCKPKIRHHDLMFLKAIEHLDVANGSVKMNDLSNYFSISAPAISQVIRRFETLGYVSREQLDHDRRSVYIQLSEQVKIEMKETEAMINANLIRLITFLGEEDSKELIRIMQKASQFRE